MAEFSFCCVFLLLVGLGASVLELPSVDRIVDGAPINITEIPYMLSYMANGEHVCGAAIIDKEWGLTAAHCVIPFVDDPSAAINVRSGSNRYDSGGVVHNVTSLSYHEKYDDQTNEYDIAVFKVDPPFDYNNATQPVKLPENPGRVNTSWGMVAGWGYFIEADPVLSGNLQYVYLPKLSKDKCVNDYKGRFNITEHQVCYGFNAGGEDTCKGDSGGPLVNDFTVIGITSWGDDCGQPYSPGVYTDVIGFVGWIKNETTSKA